MTLLTLANRLQDKLSIPRSNVVISATDGNVRTLLACINEEGKELSKRHAWQALVKEKTFTSLAQAEQTGAIPDDMGNPKRFLQDTFFNRTNVRRVTGPLSAEEWQAQQALTANVLTDSFRIRGNALLITPTPEAGDTYAFEYVSSYWVDTDDDGDGDAEAYTDDEDTTILSEDLIFLGSVWRFRKARGLDYAEEFNTYEKEVVQAMMRDGPKRTLNYAYDDSLFDGKRPPHVPEGNWSL